MKWALEWGPYEKTLRAAQKNGQKVEALDTKPILFDDLEQVWEMFFAVAKCRQSNGFGPQPLALSEIAAVLDIYQVSDAESRIEYVSLINTLDMAWLEAFSKRQSKEKEDKEVNERIRNKHQRGDQQP